MKPYCLCERLFTIVYWLLNGRTMLSKNFMPCLVLLSVCYHLIIKGWNNFSNMILCIVKLSLFECVRIFHVVVVGVRKTLKLFSIQ